MKESDVQFGLSNDVFSGGGMGVASTILNHGIGGLRPYIGKDGHTNYIVSNNGGQGKPQRIVTNAPATLRYLDWLTIDRAVIAAAKPRLRLVADLRGSGLQYSIAEGMGKTTLLTENVTDIGQADLNMDGLTRSKGERPEYNLVNLPLPIIHKDFSFPLRELMVSRNSGTPLDLTTAELAGRRVAEAAEQLHIGNWGSYSFGGNPVYGITNFPNRLTGTLTEPTASAWTPNTTVNEVLAMTQLSRDAFHYGPWVLYVSNKWDQYLDRDYIITGGATVATQTLRERISKINNIEDIRTLDYLSGYQFVLVQQTQDVIRTVVGMDITTVQWQTQGGMELNFKVMAILVPQVRADAYGNTGIVHYIGSTTNASNSTVQANTGTYPIPTV